MAEIEPIAEGLGFPEGPVVMDDGSVIVVELAAGRVTRCWNGRKEVVCQIGGGPNGAAIGPDGALWLCNNGGLDQQRMQSASGPGAEGRIERIDLATGKFERLYDACDGIPLEGPNDLVFDSAGRLWFTCMGRAHEQVRTIGGLFTCLPDGSAITAINRHAVSYNGIGLSPDQRSIYVADTFQARIYRYDNTPEAQNPQMVGTVPGHVWLDSLAMTAAGNVCVGTLHSGAITTVTAAGETATTLAFPDENFVTNIAFGGTDMRDAYVTLSGTGRLVRARWPEPGLRLAFNG